VARGSYVDPRVIDRFRAGDTVDVDVVADEIDDIGEIDPDLLAQLDAAVVDLIERAQHRRARRRARTQRRR
jgi:hypothetical protein